MIPDHLQIEVINGVCTARCTMCAFQTWTRPPRRMSNGEFSEILTKFLPYKDEINFLSLQGFGESLMDPYLPDKVKIAKYMGFRSIGFATNCTELKRNMSMRLLENGLDTIICSIDGIKKETHEAIRVGTNFEEVVENVLWFIKLRDSSKTKTKIIIRFIRQRSNMGEWLQFKEWWEKRLKKEHGDAVVSFDIVDCDNKVDGFKEKEVHKGSKHPGYCDQIYKRMIVLSNGDVALCCADDNGRFNLGNVFQYNPIAIYNNWIFDYFRRMMNAGRINELELCKTCSIPKSQERKDKA